MKTALLFLALALLVHAAENRDFNVKVGTWPPNSLRFYEGTPFLDNPTPKDVVKIAQAELHDGDILVYRNGVVSPATRDDIQHATGKILVSKADAHAILEKGDPVPDFRSPQAQAWMQAPENAFDRLRVRLGLLEQWEEKTDHH